MRGARRFVVPSPRPPLRWMAVPKRQDVLDAIAQLDAKVDRKLDDLAKRSRALPGSTVRSRRTSPP